MSRFGRSFPIQPHISRLWQVATQLFTQSASGGVTPAGALVTKTLKALTGALAPAGAIITKTLISLSGAITPTGALNLKALMALAGSLAPPPRSTTR